MKKLLFILLILPLAAISQVTIKPGQQTTVSCEVCPTCPTAAPVHDTVYLPKYIHDTVCPPVVVTPPVVVPPVTETRQNLILDNSLDDGKLTGFTLANGQYCCSYSLNVVPAPDGNGKAVKYDLRSTDAIVSSSKRSEMQLAGTDAAETSERWYGLRYWLEKYDADNGAESILQWHDGDNTTPPLSIQVQSGRMRVMQSFTSGNIPYDLGPTTTGKWIDIVIHVKWSNTTNGLLEVWRDGVKMVSKSNARTNSKGGSYMKIGINKWSWAPGGGSSTATQRIFYIDNFRMGNENAIYNDVAPTQIKSITRFFKRPKKENSLLITGTISNNSEALRKLPA
jgi:hypothetical protein